MDPNYESALLNLSHLYFELRQYDLWLETWKKGATANNDPEELKIAEEAAKVYAKAGYEAAMRRIIALQVQLAKRRYVDPADIGSNYAALGEKEQAFFWLEKAYAEKSGDVEWFKVSRSAASLRPDPRYTALRRKMGLPQ
jgi:tetratricopeptide (TPR) repeat protein